MPTEQIHPSSNSSYFAEYQNISGTEDSSRGCYCFACFVIANDGGAFDDYFKMLHLRTLSVAKIMQCVASVMDGWLDHWMLE